MKLSNWTSAMRDGEQGVESFMAALEAILISVVGRVGLWLTPLPSAYLVARSASRVFELVGIWPVVMAAIVELVGLACSHLWLSTLEWNRNKNKSDPKANEALAFGLMLAYFVVTGALLLAFELPVVLATGNPTGLTALLFPCLSAVAVIALNERAQQHKRLSDKAVSKMFKNRPRSAQYSVQDGAHDLGNGHAKGGDLGAVNRSRRERKEQLKTQMVGIYLDNPKAGATEVSRTLGIARNSVYNYLVELEAQGTVERNGNGVVVLEE